MDNVECSGMEEGLDNCTYSDSHDCTASEGAGVVCIGTARQIELMYDIFYFSHSFETPK